MTTILKTTGVLLLSLCLSQFAIAQKSALKKGTTVKVAAAPAPSLLKSGPMLAYTEIRETAIWVQTTKPASVQIQYKPVGSTAAWEESSPIMSSKDLGYTVTVVLSNLTKGTKYDYQVRIDGKKVDLPYPTQFQTLPLWQYRTDPPNFTFAVGSCNFVVDTTYDRLGKPYGSEPQIFTSIYKDKPDAFLWLGDNVYYREADWNTRSGLIYRQTHTRSQPELAPLLASTNNYAIWDDHDFGPNDANGSWPMKDAAAEVFNLFWPGLNYGLSQKLGMANTFEWGDAQFFLLDDRWFREPNEDTSKAKAFFGDVQLKWLKEALETSKATFKIVACGGQMLNSATVYENLSTYPKEYQKFIAALNNSQASGIILLSGDRHHSELSKMDRPGSYPVYELTTSPLTASPANPKETNAYRVEGTLVAGKHSYSLMSFSGPRKDRKLTIIQKGTNGEELWKREIMASELRAAKKSNE